MPPLSVPYSSRNLLERHAESFREDLLASNNPSCVVCRRPGDATWAPSPLSHTFFCRLPELARASHSCRRCCIILQGVSHFAHMFNPGYQEDDVLIRYDEDDRDHAHVLQMKRSRTARVSVGLGEQIGMVPINLRISLTTSLQPPAEFNRRGVSQGLEDSFRKIKAWMASCTSSHQFCRTGYNVLPSRVLSIAPPIIQLHETPGEVGSYAALSHCWGSLPSLKTTTNTLNLHKREVAWEALGKTYQEAITLTRHLGLNFLWIDSLCIIQDSVADWEVESARMASVYKNATITIAASNAADGSVGIFRQGSAAPYIWRRGSYNIEVSTIYPRVGLHNLNRSPYITMQHPDQWVPFPIPVSSTKSFWMGLEPTHDVLDHRRRRPPVDIVALGMPLYTRAWFLQERLMSPRIIHFGAMELYWECDSGMICECLDSDIERHNFITRNRETNARGLYASLIRYSSNQNQSIIASRSSSSIVEHSASATAAELGAWQKMVEEYSRLLLTREMDRLPALSGIANTLWQGYLAGIWIGHIPQSLCWATDATCNVFIRRPFEYRAPSFSWASIEGPVNYYNCSPAGEQFSQSKKGNVVATLVQQGSAMEGLDPRGRMKHGQITLRGYSGRATVTKIYIDATSTRCEIRRGEMVHEFQLDIPMCLGRAEPTEVQTGDAVMVLLLEYRKSIESRYIEEFGAYHFFALVLKSEGPDSQAYRRVALVGPAHEVELNNSDGRVVHGPGSMYTHASSWFDKKRDIRLV